MRFDTEVQIQIGGVWTDITDDVRHTTPIRITRGRQDEASVVDPGTCSLVLNNRHGKYSPRNPLSPYYGLIGRNTPFRASVMHGPAYLYFTGAVGQRASTPDAAALDITGDIDVRIDVSLARWQATDVIELAGKYDFVTGQASWLLMTNPFGQLLFRWSPDGATDFPQRLSTAPLDVPPSGRLAVRATLDVNNGSGGHTVVFYTAPTIAGPWTQLGDPVVTAGTTSIFSSTTPLDIGDVRTVGFIRPVGEVHAFQLRNAINGTVVANPDFTAQAPGTTSFTDSSGRTWTLEGTSEITNRRLRFRGEVSSWPTRWDTSGNDVWVPIEAAGLLRRLGQGTKPLDSTLRRRIPTGAPTAYWPMEEDREATQAFSPIAGVAPLTVAGLEFAADDTLPGSSPLPRTGESASITARVPTRSTGAWQVEMAYRIDTAPAAATTILRVNLTGTGSSGVAYVQAIASSTGIRIESRDADDVLVNSFTNTDPSQVSRFFGRWNRMQIYTVVSGALTQVWLRWLDVAADGAWIAVFANYTGTPGAPTGVTGTWGTALQGMALGHLVVYPALQTTLLDRADEGYEGENAWNRFWRLCGEQGISMQGIGRPTGTAALGPQRPATLLDLLQEVADADGGFLSEARTMPALRLRTRASMYNQPPALVLDYTAPGEVPPPLEPIDDDQKTRNDITVNRTGGSAGRAVLSTGPLSTAAPPAGVGIYDTSLTLNVSTDEQLEPMAYHLLHQGTVDEPRYPVIRIDLTAAPHLIPAVADLEIRDRIDIVNPPPHLPPGTISQIVEGYSEELDTQRWTITANCSPASPWTAAVTDDPVLGRVDTDGSELAGSTSPTATTVFVRATDGIPWTTDPAEAPWDIRAGGEVMTVTAVAAAAAATPQAAAGAASLVASLNHVAPSVNALTNADLLVCAWIPWNHTTPYTLPGTMTARAQTSGTWSCMADASQQLAAAGATGTRTATQTGTPDTWAALSILASTRTTGTPVAEQHLAAVAAKPNAVVLTTSAATQAGWWLIALQGWDKNDLNEAGGPSGTGWTLLATSGLRDPNAPYLTAYARRVTTAGAQVVTFPAGNATDNHARVYVLSGVTDLRGQAMTVVRAVNGISKGHAAGTDVRLAQPSIVSL